jgi:hypothetical protein
MTVILDPSLGVFIWLQMAPPMGDGLRKSYRKLLRWNDEFPFVKFSLAADDRPIAAVEIPPDQIDRDTLGLGIARLLVVCDLLLEETAAWIWIGGRAPDPGSRVGRNDGLFDRYADQLEELIGPR